MVDARIGPGIKSMNKFKKRKEEQQNGTIVGYTREFAGQSETNAQNMKNGIRAPERLGHIVKKKKKMIKETATVTVAASQIAPESDENYEPNTQCEIGLRLKDGVNESFIGTILPAHFNKPPIDKDLIGKMRRRKSYRPLKNRNKSIDHSMSVIDQEVWIKVKSCCGYVYENPKIGALLIDFMSFSPLGCAVHKYAASMIMPMPNVSVVNPQSPIKSLKSLPIKKQHTLGKRYIEKTGDQTEPDVHTNIDPNLIINNKLSPNLKATTTQKTQTEILNDTNLSKSTAKVCADKSQMKLSPNASETNAKKSNKLIDVLSVTKFSDNSSDSGYEETLHDTAQLNQIAKIGTSRPVILSNGVKIHVQPQNLLLAANLAGVSQTAIQTTQVNN